VELTVLGSQGTWPGPGGQTCGYLVTHEGFHLWLDAGTGTFARLQEHVGVDDIGAILVSHGHSDHFLDMIPAFYARHYGQIGDPGLPFYSPQGFADQVSMLVAEGGRDVMSEAFDFQWLMAGDQLEIGPFHVESFEMTHIGVYALGYRISADGVVLAYTGDTGPCDEAIQLGRDADLFLSEATYQNQSNLMPFHLSAAQAGELAKKAGADRLMLTHITPNLDPFVSLTEAAEVFDGTVEIATTGMMTEVRS
jgi:ribonuclease BN (tRNA processing enzyme)